MKKILLILILVIAVAAVIWIGLRLINTGDPGEDLADLLLVDETGFGGVGETINTESVAITDAKFKKLGTETVSSIWSRLGASSTQELFAFLDSKRVVSIDLEANEQKEFLQLSDSSSGLTQIEGSNGLVISSFNISPNKKILKAINLEEDREISLVKDAISASWSPDNSQIAYLSTKGIGILDADTERVTSFTELALLDLDLSWVSDENIFLISRPSILNKGIFYSFNPRTKEFTLLEYSSYGLMVNWSPGGETLLIFQNSQRDSAPSLKIRATSEREIFLDFVTLPSKCVFADKVTLYCAVPFANPIGANSPDDYLQRELYTLDNIMKIDIGSGFTESEMILDGEKGGLDIDATQLQIVGGHLLFINRYDDSLYSIELESEDEEEVQEEISESVN